MVAVQEHAVVQSEQSEAHEAPQLEVPQHGPVAVAVPHGAQHLGEQKPRLLLAEALPAAHVRVHVAVVTGQEDVHAVPANHHVQQAADVVVVTDASVGGQPLLRPNRKYDPTLDGDWPSSDLGAGLLGLRQGDRPVAGGSASRRATLHLTMSWGSSSSLFRHSWDRAAATPTLILLFLRLFVFFVGAWIFNVANGHKKVNPVKRGSGAPVSTDPSP
ncbi:hypothetical protein EYF80_044676 [Liparis tanakae]|uniref:Uncharacterized protein n=1 Tax=Liparis tanakae TaxID=230148 RepID=A0A4Z2FV47_9TELE|nr:hypothetical protein EYF80_044676 [Liparis tanakae]